MDLYPTSCLPSLCCNSTEEEGGAWGIHLGRRRGKQREEVGLLERNVVQLQDRDSTHPTLTQPGDSVTDPVSVCHSEGAGSGTLRRDSAESAGADCWAQQARAPST